MNGRKPMVSSVVLAMALLGASGLGSMSHGATSGYLSLDGASFAFRGLSTHADAPPCVNAIAAAVDASEFQGTFAGKGGFIGAAVLPDHATVTSLRFSVRDNDADENAYAYLLRKRMEPPAGGVDGFLGYSVLAQTGSSGASMDLRRFTDATVATPVVVNHRFAYFIEIVNCVDTVDPIGVQITYTQP